MQRGFTLVEMLLSIAILGIIAFMAVPVYQSFQVRNDLDIGASTIAQNARRAQELSRAADGDMTWGIKVQSGSIVVFKGTTYSSRDTVYDESFDLPTSIAPSGISEIVFAKVTGLPGATGTITLTSSINETRTITINAKGMVQY